MARDAYNCMIDLTEKKYNIPVRITQMPSSQVRKLSQGGCHYPVRSLCRLLGISSYKHTYTSDETDILSASIVLYCMYIRSSDKLPKAGCQELYALCRQYFKDKFTIERVRFYSFLCFNILMLRWISCRLPTTDFGHGYRIYDDLLNTCSKFRPCRNGSLVVCNITYIYTREEFAYLSLVTDVYSRYIVGYSLSRTLEVNGPIEALNRAIETYHHYEIDIEGMIHHSDHGVQCASKAYTNTLKSNNIRISMTQTGDPLHNALAERMNDTIKYGWFFNEGNLDFEQASKAVKILIDMYNNARPHKALNMKTSAEVFTGRKGNPLMEYRPN